MDFHPLFRCLSIRLDFPLRTARDANRAFDLIREFVVYPIDVRNGPLMKFNRLRKESLALAFTRVKFILRRLFARYSRHRCRLSRDKCWKFSTTASITRLSTFEGSVYVVFNGRRLSKSPFSKLICRVIYYVSPTLNWCSNYIDYRELITMLGTTLNSKPLTFDFQNFQNFQTLHTKDISPFYTYNRKFAFNFRESGEGTKNRINPSNIRTRDIQNVYTEC